MSGSSARIHLAATDYPHPASPDATATMKANRRRDARPELALRSVLYRRDFRFRVDDRIVLATLRVRADVVFRRERVAVLIDGRFWHGCPDRGRIPVSNQEYWQSKFWSIKSFRSAAGECLECGNTSRPRTRPRSCCCNRPATGRNLARRLGVAEDMAHG